MTTRANVRINSVEPRTIVQNEPFKANWTLELDPAFDSRSVAVTFLTDDARLLLCDHSTQESPAQKVINVSPGGKVTRSITLHLQMRKGLLNEFSRDGSASPLNLLARVHTSAQRDQLVAISPCFQIWVDNLAARLEPKIFV